MTIIHNEGERRFHGTDDGDGAFVEYRYDDNRGMILYHAEVPTRLRGKGLGKNLVEGVFEYLETNRIKARATCSFIRSVASRNPRWGQFL